MRVHRLISVFLTAFALVPALSAPPAAAKERLGAHLTVKATAYAPCAGAVGVGAMADGHYVHTGAVASNILPLETLVKLDKPIKTSDGLGRSRWRRYFRVQDRGAQFDIWMANCREAWQWGVRYIGIRIVERRR